MSERGNVVLKLSPTESTNRRLQIEILRSTVSPLNDTIDTVLYLPGRANHLVYATANLREHQWRLHLSTYGYWRLWIAHTAFDVSDAEAQLIEATFAPHGLRVERQAPIKKVSG